MNKLILTLFCGACAAFTFAQAKPLAGSNGLIGKPERLGAYQFILTGVSFATRVCFKDDVAIAARGKKFLLLNYTVQNPGSANLGLSWGDIRFTVVGADTKNYENADVALNPITMEQINIEVKPAQKVPVITFVEVPAEDPIPKLMVQAGSAPVLRFDLKGKAKKAVGSYVGANGVSFVDDAKGKVGDKLEMGYFDLQLEKVEEFSGTILDRELPDGTKFLVATFNFTNPTMQPRDLDWGTIGFTMKDSNDEDIDCGDMLLRAVGNSPLASTIKPGASLKGRYLFVADKAATPGSVTITWPNDGRSVMVKLP